MLPTYMHARFVALQRQIADMRSENAEIINKKQKTQNKKKYCT